MNKPAILFLCTGNSCRSQMAEAFLRKHAGERYEVYSAGTEPVGINPMTVRVMNEIGISMDGHRSKSLSEFLGKMQVLYSITVCERAEKACPGVWPFTLNRLSWPFDDPAACVGPEEARLTKFREVRDRIEARIQEWLANQSAHAGD